MRALLVFLLVFSTACPGTVAIIATVKSVDEGIDVFTTWAVAEESKIADTAVASCRNKMTRPEYEACTAKILEPRRAPIDKAKTAIRVYGEAVKLAQGVRTGDVLAAAAAVTGALAAVGVKVGGAK